MRRLSALPAVVILLAALLLTTASTALADGEEAAKPVEDLEARQAITAFKKAFASRDVAARVEAVRVLGEAVHPLVVDRLLTTWKKARTDEVRAAVFHALSCQKPSAEKIMKRLLKWLRAEARDERNRIRRGDPGILVDPRTGDPDVDSEEGQLRLATIKARGEMLREAVYCMRVLASEVPTDPDDFVIFLQDPLDALVIETLGALGEWKAEESLPAMLELYQMYPQEWRWETQDVSQAGGTDASAKAEWVVRFGHPGKQRARPEVLKALLASLEAITGEKFKTPDELKTWIRDRPKGKKTRKKAA